MTTDEEALRGRLAEDLFFYAQHCLTIRSKQSHLERLVFNPAQQILHHRCAAQKQKTGRVRALVLKYRQGGISTYVAARHFHLLVHALGTRGFILTHRQDTTEALFAMVSRFYHHLPESLKPQSAAANAKELRFAALDSGYRLATAGGKETGRGETIQLFHGSEVAFWPQAEQHVAGALNAVPDGAGSEIILESTANGVGGVFYEMCLAAEKGQSDFQLIFLPWFKQEDYQAIPPVGWRPSADWAAYGDLYGLSRERLFWAYRRNEIAARAIGRDPEAGPCWKFRQEFPASAEEAFQTSGEGSLLTSEAVTRARKVTLLASENAPLIFGVDVARGGGDLSWVIDRLGRKIGSVVNETRNSKDAMEIVGWVAALIQRYHPQALFIDAGGNGAAIYDRLVELGHGACLTLVNFGQRADDPKRFANKRAEMWWRLKEWLEDPGGADLPEDALLHRHLCAPRWSETSSGAILLEKKEDIKKRLGFSPDGGDAAALCFAFDVGRGRAVSFPQQKEYDPFRW